MQKLCVCTNPRDGLGVLRPVVVDEDADAAGYEDHDQRYGDFDVGYGVLQVESMTVEVEQQRHHAESQQRGAGRHQNAEGKHTGGGGITFSLPTSCKQQDCQEMWYKSLTPY